MIKIGSVLFVWVSLSLILLVFPSSSLALNSPGLTSEGTLTNGTNFGFFPQYGDINGDGYQDIVIGNYTYSSNKGRIYVYFGNGTGFSSSTNITITGEANNDYLSGRDLGNSFSLGDVNTDGFDDILIGAYANDGGGTDAGKIYVFYGSSTISGDKVASESDLSAMGNTTDKKNYGISVKIFDANKDNKNDIIIVAGTSNPTTSANIYTFLNSNNTFDFTSPNSTLATSGTNSGGVDSWVIDFTDLDGDGNIDMLMIDHNSLGKIFLFKGSSTGAFTQTSVFNAEVTSDNLGRYRSISTADINSDGVSDFCTGAYGNDTVATNQGRIYCFLGRSSFNSSYSIATADVILNGQAANDNFGRTTYLYDVTNDGKADLLVGAYQNNATAGSRHGKFFIYKNTNGTFADSP